jgi:hypothetical protein
MSLEWEPRYSRLLCFVTGQEGWVKIRPPPLRFAESPAIDLALRASGAGRRGPCKALRHLPQSCAVYGILMFGLAAGVIVFLLLAARNANRLLVASVRNGRLVWFKGHAPKSLIRDLEDVLRLRPVPSAELRILVRDRTPVVEVDGDVEEGELQRLRNIVGTWQLAKIRSAPYRRGGVER